MVAKVSPLPCSANPVWVQSVEVRRTRKMQQAPRALHVTVPSWRLCPLTKRPAVLAWAASESHDTEPLIGARTPRAAQACRRTKLAKPAHQSHSEPSLPSVYRRTQGPQ